jgi:hypothetical protein
MFRKQVFKMVVNLMLFKLIVQSHLNIFFKTYVIKKVC